MYEKVFNIVQNNPTFVSLFQSKDNFVMGDPIRKKCKYHMFDI